MSRESLSARHCAILITQSRSESAHVVMVQVRHFHQQVNSRAQSSRPNTAPEYPPNQRERESFVSHHLAQPSRARNHISLNKAGHHYQAEERRLGRQKESHLRATNIHRSSCVSGFLLLSAETVGHVITDLLIIIWNAIIIVASSAFKTCVKR